MMTFSICAAHGLVIFRKNCNWDVWLALGCCLRPIEFESAPRHAFVLLLTSRVCSLQMNAQELDANERLTEYVQRDLNTMPKLPFDDESFDACLNVVSVDYLNQPQEVFQEMHRVLRPGGQAIMSFSNRCFPTKAVAIWLGSGDAGRRRIVGSYFALSPAGGWKDITALDITGAGASSFQQGANPLQLAAAWLKIAVGDPMFVVRATKV